MSERRHRPEVPEQADEMARVRAASDGDRAAFGALYAHHGPAVARRLTHLAGKGVLVDDLLQETFLRALGALPRFRGESPFRHWILRIATSVAVDEQRRARRSLWRLFNEPEQIEEAVDARAGTERTLERSSVHAALRGLSPKLREVVIRFELEGMSLAEIAGELRVSLHTVGSRLRRGRQQLRAALAGSPRARRLAVAVALLLLLGSGALALVHRARRSPPAPPATTAVPRMPPLEGAAPASEYPASAAPDRTFSPVEASARMVAGRRGRKRPAPQATKPAPPPPAAETPPRTLDELLRPDGEQIVVRRRAELPPLFDPEEWKQQHAPAAK